MKKVISLLLSLVLVMALATGCSKSNDDDKSSNPTTAPTNAPAGEGNTDTAAAAKTGVAVLTSIAKSSDATADADGLAEVDATIVAVLVGQDGKILDCKIDVAQTKVNFSAEGKLTTDVATVFKSKQELGADYGMAKASGIGKEWNEQANAFADYVIGKTVDEVKGIAVNEGVPSDADLAASVTVHISDFVAAIDKAVAAAQDLGAVEGDKLGLGLTTDIAKSTDASAEADGLAQAYTNISVVTLGADGKVTSAIIDAVQGNVNFTVEGKVSTDLTTTYKTKLELKEDYGMKKASGIGKEWYEQANAFASYVTGKTVEEIKGIAVDAEGKATDADLTASVSVHVAPFISNIDKAAANAAK